MKTLGYTFATIASVCFLAGVAILTDKGVGECE